MNTNSNEIRVSSERQLRIGVFSRRTEVIEEKLIARQRPVILGKTPDCTIALPYSEMDKPFTLFQPLPDGRYALYFTDQFRGSLKTKNKEQSLQECIELASRQGDVYSVTLPFSAQGRIELPEVVILFSFVPVRLRAAPLLPKELRPEIFSSMDRPFVALLGLSFLLHAGVAWMATTRILPQQEPLFLEETLASLMIHQPAASAPPVEDPPTEKIAKEEDTMSEARAPAPAVTHKSAHNAAPSDEPEDGRVGLVAVLGRQSADGGPFAELFHNDDPLSALDGIPKNMKAATDGDELGAPIKKGPQEESGKLSELDEKDFVPDVPTNVPALQPKKEKPVRIVTQPPVTCDGCEPPPGPPNPGDILRPYKGRIQACYERELPNNEGLAGKLTAEFSLSTAGRVLRVDFTTDTLQSEPVSTCVAGVLRSVKFPPMDEEVKFSVSFIFDKQ